MTTQQVIGIPNGDVFYTVQPGQRLQFQFDVESAQVSFSEDGHLVIAVPDQGRVFLEGFLALEEGGNAPTVVLSDGTEIAGGVLLMSVRDRDDVETAADALESNRGLGDYNEGIGALNEGIQPVPDGPPSQDGPNQPIGDGLPGPRRVLIRSFPVRNRDLGVARILGQGLALSRDRLRTPTLNRLRFPIR